MASPVTSISPKGRRLLKAIVDFLATHQVKAGAPETYATYDQMYRMIVPNAPAVVLYVGHNLRTKGLDDLNEWTIANPSLPKITGLIVDRTKLRPGTGFFLSYQKREGKDDNWWHAQVRKALSFGWSAFIGTQQRDSPRFPADDLDEDELAPRAKSVVSRIVRDTKIAREVKALHQHTCQLCGDRVELSPGVFYAEAHHLKPLGKPHGGPDRISNMVCVCPNCHVRLDFHAIRINPANLRTAPGHLVAQAFIDHHNNLC